MAVQENRAFEEMLKVAQGWLRSHDPQDIARKADVPFDEAAGRFLIPHLGSTLTVSWPECVITPAISDWPHLVVLHYLHMADGIPVNPRLIPFAEVKDGGLSRGSNYDRKCEDLIRRVWCGRDLAKTEAACRALGAELISSNADLCAVFPFLPRYPMTLKLWLPEEDIPGSGRLFLSASAEHYLTIEDAVTAGEILWEALEDAYQMMK